MKDKTISEYNILSNCLIDYIDRNIDKPISLDILSSEMHISKFHLHRIFKNIIGEPLSSYIKRIRIEKGFMYMQTTTLSIDEISEKVGYESVYSFSKAFKSIFHESPRSFQRKKTKNEKKEDTLLYPISIIKKSRMHLAYIRFIGDSLFSISSHLYMPIR